MTVLEFWCKFTSESQHIGQLQNTLYSWQHHTLLTSSHALTLTHWLSSLRLTPSPPCLFIILQIHTYTVCICRTVTNNSPVYTLIKSWRQVKLHSTDSAEMAFNDFPLYTHIHAHTPLSVIPVRGGGVAKQALSCQISRFEGKGAGHGSGDHDEQLTTLQHYIMPRSAENWLMNDLD